ncbi:cyclin, putative [Entamoeba invadens IP1]|uniref:cyclin, putative n=1 Tax=Entamoeba invadens IP1 TaxID=370355 RepID=UPI0002C3F0FC|nr:cyclin, putative [Entamoeba invadens IP1]ELP90801.1 cyclin, putative [Entamoeba invadens IP1]|eukprot:XP_004257572.1 cyclin, putative [Entamoeba invadens IP1]
MEWIMTKAKLDEITKTFGEPELEYKKRMVHCRNIKKIGNVLGLNSKVVSLAQTVFMRFFLKRKLEGVKTEYVVAASLFLCMKLEDCRNRAIEELIRTTTEVLHITYKMEERMVLQFERAVLIGIMFRLDIDTPHTYLKRLSVLLKVDMQISIAAHNFANDMCSTYLPLTHQPFCLAILAFCFAAKQSKIELMYDADLLKNVCKELNIPIPDDSKDKTGQINLLLFFTIRADFVQQAMTALYLFYKP